MKLSKNDLICGQPAFVVRDLLKLFSAGHYQASNTHYFSPAGMSLVDVQRLILALHEEGYLEAITSEEQNEYERILRIPAESANDFPFSLHLSSKGRRIAVTRFGNRMKRKTIEKLVQTVTERARLTGSMDLLAFEVSKLWVFGSYLDADAEDYGDLDLIVETRFKPSFFGWPGTEDDLFKVEINERWEQVVTRYNEWERRYQCGQIDCRPPKPGPYYDGPYWDLKTTEYFLKRRNQKISLHSMNEFQHLKTNRLELLYDADGA